MTAARGVVAVVPIRGLGNGKTRLVGLLGPEAREALTRRMLHGVVRAALDALPVTATVVVSPDPAALAFAGSLDPAVVPLAQDPATPGLDAAAAAGRAWAMARGASALVVLFGDLPLLRAEDVEDLLDHEAPVVLAPDRHGTGTNGLVLRLTRSATGEFRFRYGPGSYARHTAEAERLDLAVATSVAPGTALDLDTPEDWQRLVGAVDDDLALVLPPQSADGPSP